MDWLGVWLLQPEVVEEAVLEGLMVLLTEEQPEALGVLLALAEAEAQLEEEPPPAPAELGLAELVPVEERH